MKRGVGSLGILTLLLLLPGCRRPAATALDEVSVSGTLGRRANAPAPALAKDAERDQGVVAGKLVTAETSPEQILPSRTTDSLTTSMVIRTGQAEIEVDSLEIAIGRVEALARGAGGFIANSSIASGENQRRSATLQIKVPSSRYEQAMSGLDGIGKLLSATTQAQDVGEEYVDVNARMANARRLEERLVTLLATRTGKLQDVLSVERELARVREEIERYEGRLRYLRANVAVSTLAVTISEPMPVVGEPGSNVVGDAFKQAWRNFVAFVAALIQSLGVLVPVVVIFGSAVLGWKRWGPKAKVVAPQA